MEKERAMHEQMIADGQAEIAADRKAAAEARAKAETELCDRS
jgi:hypothetical protein